MPSCSNSWQIELARSRVFIFYAALSVTLDCERIVWFFRKAGNELIRPDGGMWNRNCRVVYFE